MIIANLAEALSCLWATKQRAALALIGITIGISSVIAMISIGAIVETEARNQFKSLGTDFVVISRTSSADHDAKLSVRELNGELQRYASGLKQVSGYVATGSTATLGDHEAQVSVLGVTAAFNRVSRARHAAGRQISDIDGSQFFCVVGSRTAAELGVAGNPADLVGQKVKLWGHPFEVVGVLAPALPAPMEPYDLNRSVLLTPEALATLDPMAEVTQFVGRLDLKRDVERTVARVEGFFQLRFGEEQTHVETATQLLAEMEKQSRMFTLLLLAIGSISLIVGGVGVMNVMLVAVTERRREIGLRRAVGARRADVRRQFLMEALVLCSLGGCAGGLVGLVVTWLVARHSGWTFSVNYIALVAGIGFSSIVGVFFGLYPAYQASETDIIASLHAD
jgi:putative ABC transport system permease protein